MAGQEPEGFWAQIGRTYGAPPWSIYEVALALIILLVNMLWIAVMVTAIISPDALNPTSGALLIGWIIGLAFTTLILTIRWRRSSERFDALRLFGESAQARRPLALIFVIGIAASLTANLLAAMGTGLINRIDNNFEAVPALQGFPSGPTLEHILLGAVLVIIVQPITEGLLFFGIVQPRLRISLGAWPGLLLTTLLYAGYHYMIFGARPVVLAPLWYGLFAPFIAGLVLAVVRVWMRSTRATIVAAIGNGVTAFIIMLLLTI